MKFGILVFPGSNCEQDCADVIQTLLNQEVRMIWHKETTLGGIDALIIPGGFSYGDYLRTGAIARFSPVMKSVMKFAEAGGLILGICNGFQILVESKLLPGALLRNESLKYICRDVLIRVENSETSFTSLYQEGEILKIPIAHAEGNYFCNQETLEELTRNRQILFRYGGSVNPNGSLDRIAGICNSERNIAGMMPHPDRSSEMILGSEDGKRIFLSMMSHLAGARK
ncbi:MAG: phosphoribosylformylglycinamidine synthase subunit PurQ [Nitrospirae bacterium]|nr:phosphoribosylformylglycinamidine synthase subunit PurQ [Nitrospirota bacterium]MBI3594143.1 phosphoribosylformylglycinamidine synthase subunit PurQ [Nitrospirota bacterium]